MQLLTALAPPASDDHPPALRLCASPEKYVGLLIAAARDVAIAAHSAESESCLRNALRLINDAQEVRCQALFCAIILVGHILAIWASA